MSGSGSGSCQVCQMVLGVICKSYSQYHLRIVKGTFQSYFLQFSTGMWLFFNSPHTSGQGYSAWFAWSNMNSIVQVEAPQRTGHSSQALIALYKPQQI